MNTFLKKRLVFFRKVTLATAALAGLAAFAAVPRAMAHEDCQRRIRKAEHELGEAIEDHGWYSRQANHWRHELREERERCWNRRHRWWDEGHHRWHYDRDWDDDDYDRDRW